MDTRKSFGSFVGTGAEITLNSELIGFRPRSVELINVTTAASFKWTESMADGSGLYVTTAAAYVSSGGITPVDSGFTLGTHAVNGAGETIHYMVLG